MAAIDCSCSALRMASRRLTQAFDTALAPEGLTVSQFALLSGLLRREGDAPTVKDLAEALALDRTTLGHNLRPLERDGLVAIEADARDRRIRRLRITPDGRVRHGRCWPLWRATQDRFDAFFGPARAEALRADLLVIAHGGKDPAFPPATGAHPHAG